MTGWALAKYLLALAGLSLVLLADSLGRRWVGYAGLGLIIVAFLLRFLQRARARADSHRP